MMRSSTAPRIAHDATVRFQTGGGVESPFDARAVNLSIGGLFVTAPTGLQPGAQVDLQVSLRDGGAPVHARGEVVWVDDAIDDSHGMALRFVDVEPRGAERIERLVTRHAREGTGTSKRDLRIRLPTLQAPLRAVARDESEHGLMLEAELPWLELGSSIVAELSPDRAVEGVVRWVGLDVTRTGHARLRILVGIEPGERLLPPAEHRTEDVRMPRRRVRSPLLTVLGAASLIAAGAGAFALLRPPPPAASLLALPASDPAPSTARAPSVVSVPAEKPVEPAPEPPKRPVHHHAGRH